jgi:hypothetical protein
MGNKEVPNLNKRVSSSWLHTGQGILTVALFLYNIGILIKTPLCRDKLIQAFRNTKRSLFI